MLYNSHVTVRLPLSKFRSCIAEVVRKADQGEPTILTDYGRDVAAIVPITMFEPLKKKNPASDVSQNRKGRIS